MTNGRVEPGNKVLFKAGSLIHLREGFEVKMGAEFEAQIEGCE